jgi:hypothetical protein
MRRLAIALLLGSLLSACDDGGPAPAAPGPRTMWVSSRWEWASADAPPGLTVRVALWLERTTPAPRAEDCAKLPADLRVFVNDRAAEVVDAGGPQLGGLDGTEFRYCKNEGFAELGPFTPDEARALRVRVEEGGTVALAELGSGIVGPTPGPVPAQVKQGEELVLPVTFDDYLLLSHAELEWREGAATRRGASIVRHPDFRDVRLRMVGGPGPVQVTITGSYADATSQLPLCQGFTSCLLWKTALLGPITVEVLP